MSILIYERDERMRGKISNFLKRRRVLSVVVANLRYCIDDFLIGKDNFALDDKGIKILPLIMLQQNKRVILYITRFFYIYKLKSKTAEIKMKFRYNSYYDKFLAFIFVRENI